MKLLKLKWMRKGDKWTELGLICIGIVDAKVQGSLVCRAQGLFARREVYAWCCKVVRVYSKA